MTVTQTWTLRMRLGTQQAEAEPSGCQGRAHAAHGPRRLPVTCSPPQGCGLARCWALGRTGLSSAWLCPCLPHPPGSVGTAVVLRAVPPRVFLVPPWPLCWSDQVRLPIARKLKVPQEAEFFLLKLCLSFSLHGAGGLGDTCLWGGVGGVIPASSAHLPYPHDGLGPQGACLVLPIRVKGDSTQQSVMMKHSKEQYPQECVLVAVTLTRGKG